MKNSGSPIKQVSIFCLSTVLWRIYIRLHWFLMKHCSCNPARELGLQEVKKSHETKWCKIWWDKITKQSKTYTSQLLRTPHKAWKEALKFIDKSRYSSLGAWNISSVFTTGNGVVPSVNERIRGTRVQRRIFLEVSVDNQGCFNLLIRHHSETWPPQYSSPSRISSSVRHMKIRNGFQKPSETRDHKVWKEE